MKIQTEFMSQQLNSFSVEGERVLAASCIRTPSPGMKVRTQTDRAKTARKMVAELLLTDQPVREAAHDPNSELWKIATRLDITAYRFPRSVAPGEISLGCIAVPKLTVTRSMTANGTSRTIIIASSSKASGMLCLTMP